MAREHRSGRGRDELLARWASRSPGDNRLTRRLGALLLGWLVLMTIWGFGRAWHGGSAPVELAVGLVAGTIAAVIAWRRDDRR